MAERQQVALVTGANRGLGLEVCRQLERAGMRVIATSRDGKEGRERLDIADPTSVAALAERLAARGQVLDVLVNNAAIALKGFDGVIAERTIATNFHGTVTVTDVLAPAIRDHGRIVNVSSGIGELAGYPEHVKRRFTSPSLTRTALDALADEFVNDVVDGVHAKHGWPSSAYRVSKTALNAFTRIAAPELASRRILMNAVCPGWVRTDLGGPNAERSVDVGAKSIVWAALLPKDGPTGGFFRDGHAIDW